LISIVTARHPLPQETIVNSRERGEVAAAVDQVEVEAVAMAMVATMAVRMEDRTAGHRLVQTGGATSCPLSECIVLRIRQTCVVSITC